VSGALVQADVLSAGAGVFEAFVPGIQLTKVSLTPLEYVH
jgi:hypothetical protein